MDRAAAAGDQPAAGLKVQPLNVRALICKVEVDQVIDARDRELSRAIGAGNNDARIARIERRRKTVIDYTEIDQLNAIADVAKAGAERTGAKRESNNRRLKPADTGLAAQGDIAVRLDDQVTNCFDAADV